MYIGLYIYTYEEVYKEFNTAWGGGCFPRNTVQLIIVLWSYRLTCSYRNLTKRTKRNTFKSYGTTCWGLNRVKCTHYYSNVQHLPLLGIVLCQYTSYLLINHLFPLEFIARSLHLFKSKSEFRFGVVAMSLTF